MWKIGARDAVLPFVAAVALIGATHVAPAAARFGAAAAHHGAAAPRAVGYSPHMGGPRGSLPRAGAGAHSSAAGRVTSPSLSRPTFHANRLAGGSSAGSLRGHGPTTARTVHSRKSTTPAKRVGGNAPELHRRTAGPAYVRPRYHGGFTGWSGPLFWPHAYDDIFDYTFWPYDFDQTAWANAVEVLHAACPIDAVATPLARLDAMAKRLDAMLRAVDLVRPALESFYDSLRDEQKARFNAIGYAGNAPQRETGTGREGERRSYKTDFCNSDHGAALSQQSARRIERAVHPTESQRSALDDLREASARTIETLRSACPKGIPATPLARLDILDKRLDAMARAVKTIRPAMQHFYDLLGAEQKAVFNA